MGLTTHWMKMFYCANPTEVQGEGCSRNLSLGLGLLFGPHPSLSSEARSLMECEITVLSVRREATLGHGCRRCGPLQVETSVK